MKQLYFFVILIVNCLPAIGQNCLPDWNVFTQQSQIDSFDINYPGCTSIDGSLEIKGVNITNLNGLSNITAINGQLRIFSCPSLCDLNGIENLTYVGGDLVIEYNHGLSDLSGLDNLSEVGGLLNITSNQNIITISALENLSSVGGDLRINKIPFLTNLTGLENLIYLGGGLSLYNNQQLSSLTVFEDIYIPLSYLAIYNNPMLSTLSGLENFTDIQTNVFISSNGLLSDLSALSGLDSLDGYLKITGNVMLPDLTDLSNLRYVSDYIEIAYNNSITNFTGLDSITIIENYLSIEGNASLNNLAGLENLTTINGSLILQNNNALTSIGALSNLSTVHFINILGNEQLTTLEGFENITQLVEGIRIKETKSLKDLTGLNNLTFLSGFSIADNDSLLSLTGLENIDTLSGNISIKDNGLLSSLNVLEVISSITGNITVENNDQLNNLTGLHNITNITGNVSISGNESLTSMEGLNALTSIGYHFEINNNTALENLNGLENLQSIVRWGINDNNVLTNIEAPALLSTLSKLTIKGNDSLALCGTNAWLCDFVSNGGEIIIKQNAPGCDDLLSLFWSCGGEQIAYVKEDGTGDGSSWANASGNLQTTLLQASEYQAVWVAEGTYLPTLCTTCTEADRSISFVNQNNISLLGGFPPVGNPGLADRSPSLHPTILSGDIGLPDDQADNSFTVVILANYGTPFLFDGFTIQEGNSNGADEDHRFGGGMISFSSNPIISNCTFSENHADRDGGAFYSESGGGQFTYCNFENNSADNGGAVSTEEGYSPSFRNCKFENNTAVNRGGAIHYAEDATVYLGGSLFHQNVANEGGAVYVRDVTDNSIYNCTFVNNTAISEGSVFYMDDLDFEYESSFEIHSSILWGNNGFDTHLEDSGSPWYKPIDFYRSLTDKSSVEELGPKVVANCAYFGQPDPFVAIANGDFKLNMDSKAINSGQSFFSAIPGFSTDLDGNERYVDLIDIGAFEHQISQCNFNVENIIYVNASATGNNDGSNWLDAFTNLQDAINLSHKCNVDTIWMASGIYTPNGCYDCDGSNPRAFQFHTPAQFDCHSYYESLSILGGFPNTGSPGIADRDWAIYPTILSGNIGDTSTNTDNLYHLIDFGIDLYLNGLILQGGYADVSSEDLGGAIYATYNLELVNCVLKNNYTTGSGAGAFSGSTINLSNSTIENNTADQNGGGLYARKIISENNVFSNNTATEFGGGFFAKDGRSRNLFLKDVFKYNTAHTGGAGYVFGELAFTDGNEDTDVRLELKRCIFENNTAVIGACFGLIDCPFYSFNSLFHLNSADSIAAIAHISMDVKNYKDYVYNCTFANNNAPYSPSLIHNPSNKNAITQKNNLFFNNNNNTIPFSGIQHLYSCAFDVADCHELGSDVSCIKQMFFDIPDPFVDAQNGDFNLNDSTIAISNGVYYESPFSSISEFDLPGNPRLIGTFIDIGAYEYVNIFDEDGDGYFSDVDCDDTEATINPGVPEIPNNDIDENCDGFLEIDNDNDGFTDEVDCDDNNPDINPGAQEIIYNGFDDDCDPSTLDDDLDQDGFPLAEDCNDEDATINPDVMENPYNGIDDDCNELTLDDDLDGDGFVLAEDCNDEDSSINPDMEEIPNNGIDEDCDGEDLLISAKGLTQLQPKIYPNPTTDKLIIRLTNQFQTTELQLKTITGKTIISGKFNTITSLDLSKFPAGLYFLTVQTPTHSFTEKVVKQ